MDHQVKINEILEKAAKCRIVGTEIAFDKYGGITAFVTTLEMD